MIEPLLEQIDTLLQRLLLGSGVGALSKVSPADYEYAFRRASNLLRANDESDDGSRFEIRLRLAMHLAPISAINYVGTNSTPRYRLIANHLITEFGREPSLAEAVARDVAKTLSSWEQTRESLAAHRPELIRRQAGLCGHCHMKFYETPVTALNLDEFKPYHHALEELIKPEVDHIEAISCLGTNELINLQALCRLCNEGKGDGLGIDIRHEVRWSGVPVDQVDRSHRARVLYHVILRDNRCCRLCRDERKELTVRKVRDDGAYARSNLLTVCVDCVPQSTGHVGKLAA